MIVQFGFSRWAPKLAKTILWVNRLAQTDCIHFLKCKKKIFWEKKILARVTSRWERIRFIAKNLGDRSWPGFLIQGHEGCGHYESGNIQEQSKRNMETSSKYDWKLLKSSFYLKLWLPFLVFFGGHMKFSNTRTAHNSHTSHMTRWH